MYWGYSSKGSLFAPSESAHDEYMDITAERKPIRIVVRAAPQRLEPKGKLPAFCHLVDQEITVNTGKPEYSSFDKVLGANTTNRDLYNCLNEDMEVVQNVLDAFNSTVITYGAAFSGKSYSLLGGNADGSLEQNTTYLLCKELFAKIEEESREKGTKFSIKLNAFEVSLEKIYDLLAPESSKKKSLKLHHEDNKLEYNIKDLSSAVVTSIDDVAKHLTDISRRTQIESRAKRRSRSHVFFKLSIEQRNVADETLKLSALTIVDLAGCDLVTKEKAKHIPSDEIKKLNTETKAFKHVVDVVSEYETKQHRNIPESSIPYRESTLTKLLLSPLIGNSLTTFLVCCSTDRIDEKDSMKTLLSAGVIRRIRTNVRPNVFGLHQKKKMTLFYEAMKTKEQNYLSRIQQLEQERDSMRDKYSGNSQGSAQSPISIELKKSEAENKALIEQLALLRSALQNGGDGKSVDAQQTGSIMDITNSLIEKSSKVVELQSSIEETKHMNFILKGKLKGIDGRDKALEDMNTKLMSQIKAHEKMIQDLLTANAAIESELDHFKEINKIRTEKLQLMEERMSKLNLGSSGQDNASSIRNNSLSASSGHTMVPIDEGKVGFGGSSWSNPSPKTTVPRNRQVSVGSIGQSSTEDGFVPRPLKKGLKLNSVRVVSGPATSPNRPHTNS